MITPLRFDDISMWCVIFSWFSAGQIFLNIDYAISPAAITPLILRYWCQPPRLLFRHYFSRHYDDIYELMPPQHYADAAIDITPAISRHYDADIIDIDITDVGFWYWLIIDWDIVSFHWLLPRHFDTGCCWCWWEDTNISSLMPNIDIDGADADDSRRLLILINISSTLWWYDYAAAGAFDYWPAGHISSHYADASPGAIDEDYLITPMNITPPKMPIDVPINRCCRRHWLRQNTINISLKYWCADKAITYITPTFRRHFNRKMPADIIVGLTPGWLMDIDYFDIDMPF